MTAAVTAQRWYDAQDAEQSFWTELSSSTSEFMHVLNEKVETAAWIASVRKPNSGDWVEIGIGPLGVGCMHFIPDTGVRALVGVEPLPLLGLREINLPAPLIAIVQACRTERYVHRSGTGEATGLGAGQFGFALCYNVLDHVRDPAAVLSEASRILTEDGQLLLGCDAFSLAGRVRHHAYIKRRFGDQVGVRAHPFRFAAHELVELIEDAGFHIRDARSLPGRRQQLIGRRQRLLILAEKPMPARVEAT
jgi:SAM-dependent methyltransferase